MPLHSKLEALRVIASSGRPSDEKPFCKQQSRDFDETTVCSDLDDLVTATCSLKTTASTQSGLGEMLEFQVAPEDDVPPEVPICAGEVLATPARCARDTYASTRNQPIIIRSIAELGEPTVWS